MAAKEAIRFTDVVGSKGEPVDRGSDFWEFGTGPDRATKLTNLGKHLGGIVAQNVRHETHASTPYMDTLDAARGLTADYRNVVQPPLEMPEVTTLSQTISGTALEIMNGGGNV